MPPHVFGDGRLTHRDPQLLKLSMHPRRAPEWIRRGDFTNQRADIAGHGRASGAVSAFPGPEQTKAAQVLRDHGFRRDDLNGRAPASNGRAPAAPRLREPRPQYPVSWRESKTWRAASIDDGELVSECDDFQMQRGA